MKQIIVKIIYKVTIITLVLGFLIQTISMFPFYVFASNEETLNEIEINSVNNVDENDVRLLYEVEDMKDEYLKVFRRTDGKLEYAYYDEMVNYFDGEKYVEVDASYKEESNEYSQSVNKYSVKLPKKLQDSKKIKLSFNNSSSIEITYNDISKVEGNVIKKTSKSDRIDELKNISGSVLYNNIFNNVDLLIESSGTKFKENIILNEYISNFSFSYNIKLKSLSLLKEDNIYKFINEEGTIVYEISPYFMWDSNMTYSEDIKVLVEEVKQNEYKFTVTPSNEYLSKATYPVTIDPVLSYNASSSSDSVIKIKTIQKGFNNCSVNSYLQLTKYINEVEGVKENLGYYGIMEVDLTDIPLLEYVDSSFIRLHCIESNTTENALVTRIYTHSYSDINGNTSYNKLSSSVEIEKANDNYYTLDFTNFYNTNKNSVCVYEISPENFIYNESTQLFSNHLTNSNVPVLNLISFDYEGLSSNRTYESVSAGDAGVINIDNALGSSNLSIPVYSNNYLNLTHYYSQLSSNNYMFGNKMSVNLVETLTVFNNTSLCYTNGTGYKEYFYLDTTTNTYKSEDGNSSTIKIENSKYYYRFDSIEKEFSQNGTLLKTTLNYDNPDEHLRKEIHYLTTNNIIHNVTTDDTKIVFYYKTLNSKNILDYVIVQRLINGDFEDYIKIVYSYDANYNVINIKKYLGDITQMENKIIEIENDNDLINSEKEAFIIAEYLKCFQYQNYYEYDSSNRLTKAYTSTNYTSYADSKNTYQGISLNYLNAKVSSYSYKVVNDETVKEAMTFNYGENKTIVTDYTGYSRTYLFDYFNHTINVQDSNGYVTAYTYANFAGEMSQESPQYYLKNQINHVSDPINVSISPLLNGGFENVTETGDVCMWNETSTTNLSTSNLTQDSAYGTFALKLGQPSNSTVSSCYQKIYLPIGNYNLSSIVKIATRRTDNSLIGYIKVEGELDGSVESEELTFSNKTYEYVSTSFTVEYPTYVTITCGVRLTTGKLLLNTDAAYFDNIGIGNGNIYTNYNMLENSSFEINKAIIGDETVDTRWNLINSQIGERYQISEQFGISELLLRNNGTAMQTLSFNTKPGDLFNLSAFSRYDDGYGNVKVKVRFYDSTSSYTTDYYTLQFTNGIKVEQFAIGNIEVGKPTSLEDDVDVEELGIQYNRIEVLIFNDSQKTAFVDNVALVPITNGKNYLYNESSKVIQIKEGNQTTNITYNTDGHTISKIETNNSSIQINKEYNDDTTINGYITSSIEFLSNNTTSLKSINFKNDTNTSVLTSYIDSDGYGYTTSAVYDDYYQYQLSYTDEFGNTTNYEYDYYTGNITKTRLDYYNYYSNETTFLNFIYGYNGNGNISYVRMTNTKTNENYDETEAESIVNPKEIELATRVLGYSYDERGNIVEITINGSQNKKYYFSYDEFNMLKEIKLNNEVIKQFEYLTINGINTGIITKEINGKVEENSYDYTYYQYQYDENYNLISYEYYYYDNQTLVRMPIATYKYDDYSKVIYYKDELEKTIYYYDYNNIGALIKVNICSENSDYTDYICITYDEENRIKEIEKNFNNNIQITTYTYEDNEISELRINDSIYRKPKEILSEDKKFIESFIRNVENGTQDIINEKNYYKEAEQFLVVDENNSAVTSSNKISTRISKQEFTINGTIYTYNYTYDNLGNITSIETRNTESSDVTKYLYNYYFGQLINETVEKNNVVIYNCTYRYDSYGNVIEINREVKIDIYSDYPESQYFSYDNNNQLTEYTIDGVTYQVSYNNGNPLTYKDYNLTFNNGNLTSLTNTNNNITYEYNADGIRIKKVVNNITTLYTVFNGIIIEETVTGSNGYTIKYIYDDNNLLLGFIYNNETYYYQRTLTGEITRIVNSNGIIVGEYNYDAYGNILNLDELSEIAEINPFRYKGYYYDQEINLYYCKSRYYSPEICRWISRDEIEYLDPSSITGCNLYAYCYNNPIMYVDENGDTPWPFEHSVLAALTGITTIVSIANHVCSAIMGHKSSKSVEDSYNEAEAKKAIETITGKDSVTINETNIYIENSYKIDSRYERILISKIITNMVDENGNKKTNRTAYGLAAEWYGHNVLAKCGIMPANTEHVNLDYKFKDNAWYTKLGTIILLSLGFL